MIALVLIAIGAIRAHDDFHGSDLTVWGWRIGLVVAWLALVALWVAMRRPPSPGLRPPGADGGELAGRVVEPADEPRQ